MPSQNIMKNMTRAVVVTPHLKSDSPIIKNHLTTSNIRTNRKFQKKHEI